MDRGEMARLLAKIQLGDNRQITTLVLNDWMETVGDLNYEDAYQAVNHHRRTSTEWVMPAHIRRYAQRARDDRARRERMRQPAITHQVTLDPVKHRAETAAACEWFRDHPGATTADYFNYLDGKQDE